MMLLRARTLCAGYSGVRPLSPNRWRRCSTAAWCRGCRSTARWARPGDLAPLAHATACLLGEGWVWDGAHAACRRRPALAAHGLRPIDVGPREGLALINGTDGMSAVLTLAVADLGDLLRAADVIAAMSVEALLGTTRAFAENAVALRPAPGQAASAANLRALLADSTLVASHRDSHHAVQDPYSLRCTPQVHGAARDVHGFARETRGARARRRGRQPHGARRRGGERRQLPRPGARLRRRHAGQRVRRRGRDQRAPPRPAARPGAVARPARLPHRQSRAQQRADDHASTRPRRWWSSCAPPPRPSRCTACRRAPGRRTTCRWASRRRCAPAAAWPPCAACSPSELVAAAQALELRAPLRPGPATAALVASLRERVAPPRRRPRPGRRPRRGGGMAARVPLARRAAAASADALR